MYSGKKILALITARGGSKGIPRKNIKKLGGKPLICWSIEAAAMSRYIDKLILSSEDLEIINIAKRSGCEVPFIRPKELAADDTPSIDVILHVLDEITSDYDYLLLLQPTSPFRTSHDIDEIIEKCISQGYKIMVSVAAVKKHPMFMYKMDGPFLRSFVTSEKQLRRQDMPPAYEHNGSLYLAEIEYLKKNKSFISGDVTPYEMFGPANLDLDELYDWEYAEYLISKGKVL